MRTPAGFECRFFYGNYFRGRRQEECRLIGDQPAPEHWTPDLCTKCPVPEILRANACAELELKAQVKRTWFGLFRGVDVFAYCQRSQQPVAEPHIGCGQCSPLPFIFTDKK